MLADSEQRGPLDTLVSDCCREAFTSPAWCQAALSQHHSRSGQVQAAQTDFAEPYRLTRIECKHNIRQMIRRAFNGNFVHSYRSKRVSPVLQLREHLFDIVLQRPLSVASTRDYEMTGR